MYLRRPYRRRDRAVLGVAVSTHTPGYDITQGGLVYSNLNWRGYGRRPLRQNLNSYGYPSVRILRNGKRTRVCVHVLMALEYLGPRPSPSHEVRHLDGNKLNNNIFNLAWGTRADNAADRERHGNTSRIAKAEGRP